VSNRRIEHEATTSNQARNGFYSGSFFSSWSYDRAVSVGGFPTFQMKAGALENPEQFEIVDVNTSKVNFLRKDKLTLMDMAAPIPMIMNSALIAPHVTETDPWGLAGQNVVRVLCDHVLVMYLGKLVETGPTDAVFNHSQHPYTQALVSAIPSFAATASRISLSGEPRSPVNPSAHICRLYGRCPKGDERCCRIMPELQPVSDSHQVACHHR